MRRFDTINYNLLDSTIRDGGHAVDGYICDIAFLVCRHKRKKRKKPFE